MRDKVIGIMGDASVLIPRYIIINLSNFLCQLTGCLLRKGRCK